MAGAIYKIPLREENTPNEDPSLQGVPPATPVCKVYRRRWFVLALFAVNSGVNAFQWIQYSIITDVVMKYYGVSDQAVNWTSMMYMLAFIPFMLPAAWVMDNKGLRWATALGALGHAVGAWIKVASASPDRFFVTMIGQLFPSIAQSFVLSTPSRLAAVWFGPEEVSTACAIGVFGNQLGAALGFFIPPMVVKDHANLDDIGANFSVLFYGVAIVCTVLLVLVLLFFPAEPPTPPSPAQAARLTSTSEQFLPSIKRLMSNPAFVLLFFSYGINVGVYNAVATTLNQVVVNYFPNKGGDAGTIGLILVLAGIVGSIICGVILDKTHKFKETTVAVYALTTVVMVAYTFMFRTGSMAAVYSVSALLGFFMTGYMPVGFEMAAELTYPEPEGTSSGILNTSIQLFGVAFTLLFGWLQDLVGDVWSNLAMCAALLVGTILTVITPGHLRRQAAGKRVHEAP